MVFKKPGSDLLSHALRRSTIGAEDFYFRVRNGIGYGIFAITTRLFKYQISLLNHHREKKTYYCTRYFKPIELLVPVSYTYYYASTSGLSTWQSSTTLKGYLVLRQVSRLDAFSGYPFHTQLPCDATGVTTGTPEVCPSRSSRTKDRSSQVSYTHGRQGPNCLTTF